MYTYYYDFPVGRMGISELDGEITRVFYTASSKINLQKSLERDRIEETALIKRVAEQLDEYFRGVRKQFDLPLRLDVSEFSKRVYNALLDVPYGKTASYREIAKKAGSPKAFRAVGHANNKNPIAIIIPCHRIIGSNGALIGYAGGLEIKRLLLNLEKHD